RAPADTRRARARRRREDARRRGARDQLPRPDEEAAPPRAVAARAPGLRLGTADDQAGGVAAEAVRGDQRRVQRRAPLAMTDGVEAALGIRLVAARGGRGD